ncbi:hypothetical protein GVAV_000512 [Gurleya vavrai]
MKTFNLTSSIPASNSSQCLLSHSTLFFTTNCTFYNPQHVCTLPSPIISFSVSTHIFLQTETFIYQLNFSGRIISKLRLHKKVNLIKCNDIYLFIFNLSYIEIFYIPKEYKPLMYQLKKRIFISSKITKSSIFDNLLLTANINNTVILYDFENHREEIIGSFIEEIVEVYINKIQIIIFCKDCVIFYNYKAKKDLIDDENKNEILEYKNIIKKIILKNIISVSFENELYYVAFRNEKEIIKICILSEFNIQEEFLEEYDDLQSITINQNQMALNYSNKIELYNLNSKTVEKTFNNLEILSFCTFKNFKFMATEKEIQIYKEDELLKIYDLSVDTRIVHIQASSNLLFTLSSLGLVKMYDIQNLYCFKSFNIPFNVLCTEINEDASLLFFANTTIYIYDMKRGKCIDEIHSHKGPILKMINYGSYLFSLGMDNEFARNDIYDTKKTSIFIKNESKKTILDFSLNKNIYLLYTDEIVIYTKDFVFVKTFSIKDYERKITFEKLELLNDSIAFLYGYNKERFFIYLYSIEHGIKIQELEIPKLKKMHVKNNKLILHSKNFFYIYSQKEFSFSPVDLEIDCDEEKVNKFIFEKNYLFALICALKINIFEIVQNVLINIPEDEIEFTAKNIVEKYIPRLREIINLTDVSYKWIKFLIFYHTGNGKELEVKMKMKEDMKLARLNFYMLESIKRKN